MEVRYPYLELTLAAPGGDRHARCRVCHAAHERVKSKGFGRPDEVLRPLGGLSTGQVRSRIYPASSS